MSTPYATHVGSHAIERAWERYGVALTPHELALLGAQCGNGRTVRLRVQADRSEVHLVRHAEVTMVAVWDPATRAIITFLPNDAKVSIGRNMVGQRPSGAEQADGRFAERRRRQRSRRR
jgi:hypothetical protein